jgi:hypothetical protein
MFVRWGRRRDTSPAPRMRTGLAASDGCGKLTRCLHACAGGITQAGRFFRGMPPAGEFAGLRGAQVFHESTKITLPDVVEAIKSRHQRCRYEKNDCQRR